MSREKGSAWSIIRKSLTLIRLINHCIFDLHCDNNKWVSENIPFAQFPGQTQILILEIPSVLPRLKLSSSLILNKIEIYKIPIFLLKTD